jgi:hypothetical protein
VRRCALRIACTWPQATHCNSEQGGIAGCEPVLGPWFGGTSMSGSSASGQIDSSTGGSQSDTLAATSVQMGRIAKKKGLSRHYPHKAQSFDCIASLAASVGAQAGAYVLSKSLSRRRTCSGPARHTCSAAGLAITEPAGLATIRRAHSSGTIQECPTEESACSDETELCCALQLQVTLHQRPAVCQRREHERHGSDATSSYDSNTA